MTVPSCISEILEYVRKTPHAAFFFTPPQCGPDAQSWFFSGKSPLAHLVAHQYPEIDPLFEMIDAFAFSRFGYGFISYNTGFPLRGIVSHHKPASPLAEFYFFDSSEVILYQSGDLLENYHPTEKPVCLHNPVSDNDKDDYISSIDAIKKYIISGDTYQVNFTTQTRFTLAGTADNLFLRLIFNQSAPYSAFINTGQSIIVSLSPELFFETDQSVIRCRPMKGTSCRGINPHHDAHLRETLFQSEKNRAENLMIVDLMRNDINAIDRATCAQTISLFDIEEYETVFQMTSTIESVHPPGTGLSTIIRTLFPCGSVTGAPKRRTMEIIDSLERSQRGIYTGAIGLLTPHKAVFSVPIRTAVIDTKTNIGTIGTGSGIIWDSSPVDEYAETMSKIDFFTDQNPPFYIFETMLFENGRVFLLDEHCDRLKRSASRFRFIYDDTVIRKKLAVSIATLTSTAKIRLALYKWGAVDIDIEEGEFTIKTPVDIRLSENIIDSGDLFRYYKTSRRELFSQERNRLRGDGIFEVIFANEKGNLTEGSITNLFLRINGRWHTPSVDDGLLEGVYRNYFITLHDAIETPLRRGDIFAADKMIIVNSLRKEIRVKRVLFADNTGRNFE
jgi:para-aminobenzoate synthetase/4-amino-4-deoxychorismate lyase